MAMFFEPIGHARAMSDEVRAKFTKLKFNNAGMERIMVSSKELRERRGQLHSQFKAIIDRAEAEDRDITAAENATLEQLNRDDEALRNRIEKQESLALRSEELSTPIDRSGRRQGDGGSIFGGHSQAEATDLDCAVATFATNSLGRAVDARTLERAAQGGYTPGATALEIPLNLIRPTPGNRVTLSRFSNAMSTKVPGKGGVLVASGFMGRLEKALKQFSPMLETSQVMTTSDGREIPWPTLDDTNMEGFLIAENEEAAETDLMVGARLFRSHKISSGLIKVSHEMLEDTPIDLAGEIGEALGIRVGRAMNRLFTVGQTANGPTGILLSAVLGKETASSAAITADEFIDLINSVDPAYRSATGTGWMMHPDIWGALTKLKDNQGQYLTGTLEAGAVPKLRGYDVHFNPHMPATLAAGNRVALFGDLNAYKIRMVGQVRLVVMREAYAAADQQGFVAFARVDGALLDAGTHPVKCLQMKPA